MTQHEYQIDPVLAEMVQAVRGNADRFIRVRVEPKKLGERPHNLDFTGDQVDLIDNLANFLKTKNVRVVSQAIGTIIED